MRTLIGSFGLWMVQCGFGLLGMTKSTPKPSSLPGPKDSERPMLRMEASIETGMSGPQLAVLLRRVAEQEVGANKEVLQQLAIEAEDSTRSTYPGTRASVLITASEGPVTFEPDHLRDAVVYLHDEARKMTKEPGDLLEIRMEVLIESKATARSEGPKLTRLRSAVDLNKLPKTKPE